MWLARRANKAANVVWGREGSTGCRQQAGALAVLETTEVTACWCACSVLQGSNPCKNFGGEVSTPLTFFCFSLGNLNEIFQYIPLIWIWFGTTVNSKLRCPIKGHDLAIIFCNSWLHHTFLDALGLCLTEVWCIAGITGLQCSWHLTRSLKFTASSSKCCWALAGSQPFRTEFVGIKV